jgi:hypothetical protein
MEKINHEAHEAHEEGDFITVPNGDSHDASLDMA